MDEDKNCLENFTINKLKTYEYETMQKLAKEQAAKIFKKIQNNIEVAFYRGESKSKNYIIYDNINERLHPINIQILKQNKFKDKSTLLTLSYFICWDVETDEDVREIKNIITNYYNNDKRYYIAVKCTIYEL